MISYIRKDKFIVYIIFLCCLSYIYLYNLNFILLKKIVINNYTDTSDLFIKSVKLYNQRISYINRNYFKIKKCNGKLKAIVVLLLYNEIKQFITSNYLFLKLHYHDKLIFYVTQYKNVIEEYSSIKYYVIDISNNFYSFPYNFNESAYSSIYKKRGKWNYQHMCRFFFKDIFMHPSLCNVDMYMRLDSDSILNTTLNLFLYMDKSIVYMHNRVMNDKFSVVKELKDFTLSFVKALKVEANDKNKYNSAFKNTVKLYYNNFEICRLKFFRSKDILQFTSLVDLSYGQFIYRWGDAPLRYISLSLYTKNNTIISLPKGVKYCHNKCFLT